MSEFLNCPFCGSENVSLSYCTNVENIVSGRFVECEDCAACGPVHPAEYYATTAWNSRSPIHVPPTCTENGEKLTGPGREESFHERLMRFGQEKNYAAILELLRSPVPPDDGAERVHAGSEQSEHRDAPAPISRERLVEILLAHGAFSSALADALLLALKEEP